MALICEVCKSADTQVELNTAFCFRCGHRTPMSKLKYQPPSEEPKEEE